LNPSTTRDYPLRTAILLRQVFSVTVFSDLLSAGFQRLLSLLAGTIQPQLPIGTDFQLSNYLTESKLCYDRRPVGTHLESVTNLVRDSLCRAPSLTRGRVCSLRSSLNSSIVSSCSYRTDSVENAISVTPLLRIRNPLPSNGYICTDVP
jgi:hypothetical protein